MILKLLLLLAFFVCVPAYGNIKITNVSGQQCKDGIHTNPTSDFSIFVFCDDALGTNIAIFLSKLEIPLKKNYNLGDRFWQGQEWSRGVETFAWLGSDRLLITTSAEQGLGGVYKVDAAKKLIETLYSNSNAGALKLTFVTEHQINIEYEEGIGNIKKITLSL